MFERKQNVHFKTNVDVFSILTTPVASDMTVEEKRSIWYSKDELRTLRGNAREASRLIRQKYEDASFHVPQHYFISEYEACSRGLELRIDPERQENKHATRHIIMKYQQRLRLGVTSSTSVIADPKLYLANVSKTLSQRSRDMALSTARKDYFAAYPEMESLVSALMDPIPIADFPRLKRKLNMTTTEHSLVFPCGMERRVKRRILTRMDSCV
uniref:Uncharacterized protein n=1 Tax=Ditylum brightwellii TaxID=49249 RepID=A0A7S1Z8T7_9STRA|mmetsp:Transcript_27013/g.40140  ORF Transcript_27013/g.40140 Transcript_27013/m.40140 type:complete len:213 (+) Transcript_27013:97-735(+)